MNKGGFANAVGFLALVLMQIVAFNNISIGLMISPFIYGFAILLLSPKTPYWLVLLIAFITGLFVDMFSGTIGMHAAACTALAFTRNQILGRILSYDADDFQAPRIREVGFRTFAVYLFVPLLVQHIVYFVLENGTFFNFFFLLGKIIFSTLFSGLIIILIDLFFYTKAKRKY